MMTLLSLAQLQGAPPTEHKMIAPDAVQWGEAPPMFSKGAKMAVLYGDPFKTGMFIVRLKVPANYKIMPHWHPTDENITVVSGSFGVGMGDKFDPKIQTMGPGAFVTMPAKMHHFGYAAKDSVVEISSTGPFALIYVNPADDPSKAEMMK